MERASAAVSSSSRERWCIQEHTTIAMSTVYCSGCLQGLCRRHPLQDHGKREQQIKKEAETRGAGSQLSRSYSEIIQAQIEKLKNESKGMAEDENEKFRQSLQDEREKDMIEMGKKRQKLGSTNSGLRPDVAALLVSSGSEGDGGDDSGSESTSSRSISSGSSAAAAVKKKKKAKKETKKRKRKEKKEKKEKRGRKDKKEKKEKKEKKKDKK